VINVLQPCPEKGKGKPCELENMGRCPNQRLIVRLRFEKSLYKTCLYRAGRRIFDKSEDSPRWPRADFKRFSRCYRGQQPRPHRSSFIQKYSPVRPQARGKKRGMEGGAPFYTAVRRIPLPPEVRIAMRPYTRADVCHCERSEAISKVRGLLVGPASCRSSPIDRRDACPAVHSSQRQMMPSAI